MTDEEIIQMARGYPSRFAWSRGHNKEYMIAYRRGLLPKIYEFLPPGDGPQSPYTDDELTEHAKNFPDRRAWRLAGIKERGNGKASHYGVALKRGGVFFKKCCAHMKRLPTALGHFKYTAEQIIESAKPYNTVGEWKKVCPLLYHVALRRREIHAQATAHMVAAASPYAGDYIIYAYEFSDGYAYVGLTFQKEARHQGHIARGPVHDHLQVCSNVVYKILQKDIAIPKEAARLERVWIASYRNNFKLLNTSVGGGTGTVHTKWTKDLLIEEAQKYRTRKDWLLGSQGTYKTSKRMGCFSECVAHMPRYNATHLFGREFSPETGALMSEKARQRTSDPVWRSGHSAKIRGRKHTQAEKDRIRSALLARTDNPNALGRLLKKGNLFSQCPQFPPQFLPQCPPLPAPMPADVGNGNPLTAAEVQSTGKCHQRLIRERLLEADTQMLQAKGLRPEDLKASQFVLAREEYSPCIREFIQRYEWLGTVGVSPKWVFTARMGGLLGGVVLINEPTSYMKNKELRLVEALVQRGACAAWTPKNLGSRMIMFACRWMLENTSKRVFVAYSDPSAGEIGTIYQACNWMYLGADWGGTCLLRHPTYRPAKPFSAQSLRRTSVLKWWCKHIAKIVVHPSWFKANGFKDLSAIPPEVKRAWYDWGTRIVSECEKIPQAKKGKYCLILGSPKEVESLKLSLNLKVFPYPKRTSSTP